MSDTFTIWHNPRCSKSRQALQRLRDRGVEPVVIEYLKAPPARNAIERVLALLKMEPRELMRPRESVFAELGLQDQRKTRAQLLDALEQHPILIERPVVIRGDKAVVARPPERVDELL